MFKFVTYECLQHGCTGQYLPVLGRPSRGRPDFQEQGATLHPHRVLPVHVQVWVVQRVLPSRHTRRGKNNNETLLF